jgi:acetyl-CoA acetyltransferase
VAAGLCDHVLCFRTVWEASAQGDQGRASVTMGGGGGGSYRASGFMQWTLPFGAPSASNWIGMMAQRHFHEFGTTREQLAERPPPTPLRDHVASALAGGEGMSRVRRPSR